MRLRFVTLKENVLLALDTLRQHKFRTFLTILGVFIGVFIIIGVASVLNGFRHSVISSVEEFGTRNIYIHRFPLFQMGRMPPEVRQRKPLTVEDAEAIRDLCPAVEHVSAGLEKFPPPAVKYRGREAQTTGLRGGFSEWEMVGNVSLEDGRYFSAAENEHATEVAVIGANVKDALFPNLSALEKEITVDGKNFRVIGVEEKHKAGAFGDDSEDNYISIPYRTFKKIYPNADDHFIAARAREGQLDKALDQITELLRRRRHVKHNQPDNFGIGTAQSIIERFDQITFAVLAVMVAISSVAFMVGGVGVMNIMLVSVTERTREIGIRKAIGARRIDIVLQFLTEAMALTGAGGLLGIVFGMLLAFAINRLMPNLPAVVPAWAIAFGFLGSVSVGLFFGIWPAAKAAKLDPIEALRYE
ncbi:MAG TPA: ABC transporter permease [Acidobacteriota bacterium]|jgi:putative ABC transport system permease protein